MKVLLNKNHLVRGGIRIQNTFQFQVYTMFSSISDSLNGICSDPNDHEETNMETGALAKAIFSFKTDIEGELNLNVGDIIQIVKTVDRHWYYGTNGFQFGNFPAGFVIEQEVPRIEENQEIFITFENFAAVESGDLGFNKNDVIIGIKPIDSNWWYGERDGRQGIFPVSHVWKADLSLIKQKQSSQKVRIKARVKMGMKAQLEEEIDLVAGEMITVTEIIDEDWMRGESKGKSGVFPSAYVILEPDDTIQKLEQLNSTSITSEQLDSSILRSSVPGYHCGNSGITPYGRTCYSFVAQYPDELCFHAGELVTILRHVDSQWLEGELGGKCGFFPKSHIDIIVDCATNDTGEKMTTVPQPPIEIIPGVTEARVLYDYIAQGPEDLNLVEDEVITISKKLNDEWYEAKDSQGILGLCPANYVAISPSKQNYTAEECNNNKPVKMSLTNSDFKMNTTIERHLDFSRLRCSSETDALDKSIAKNLANLDLSLSASPKPRSVSFTQVLTQKQEQKEQLRKIALSIPPPRPSPPNLARKSISELPARPPPPVISTPPPIPPPPLVSTPPSRSPPIIPFEEVKCPIVPVNQHEEKVLAPFRAAPPPPIKVVAVNGQSYDQQTKSLEANTSWRLPHRPAPPPPIGLRSKDSMDSFNGLQRKITERENNLKQLKSAKQELDSHVITRQSSQTAMQEHVKAYEDTIDGLTDEITSLKESAKNASLQNSSEEPEIRAKNIEKRKLVITELVKTEQDYVSELKLCWDIFVNCADSIKDKRIDFDTLFGNLDQIIKLGEQLLENFKSDSGELDVDSILVGTCFENIAAVMKEVYANYCSNHDDVIHLLEKYQENESIQHFINEKLNIMREKTSCFSLGAILIKPVQRILKYPLLLNELIKVTEDDHPDMIHLQKAIQVMTDVATSINEYKRRKEIVVKYRQEEDTSIAATFSKINLHSLVKKSNRIGMRLSSTIGLTSVTKDEVFDAEEQKFRVLDKTIKTFIKDVTDFCILLEEWVTGQFHVGEHFASIFASQSRLPHLDHYRSILQREIFQVIWKDFKTTVTTRVAHPLSELLHLFQGPTKLIDKRYDKLLDYDSSTKKVEKNKDISKSKQIREEQSSMKNMYEALNAQLIEELPKFFTLSLNIFLDCTIHFFVARKKFIGRISKEMLSLMDIPAFCTSRGDILEDFETKHAHVASQLITFNFIPKNFFLQRMDSFRDKKPKLNANKENVLSNSKQSDLDRDKVKVQYSPSSCYCAIKLFQTNDKFEVPLAIGDIVGVIKQQDPMGGTNRWFIDNGVIKGFAPADCLVPTASGTLDKRRRFSAEQAPNYLPPGFSQAPLQPIPISKQHEALAVNLPSKPLPIDAKDPPPSYYDVPPDDVIDQRYDLPFDDFEEPAEAREVYFAAYDLESSMAGTISLTRGESLYVVHKHDMEGNPEWWYMESMTGHKGYVPANYLIKR